MGKPRIAFNDKWPTEYPGSRLFLLCTVCDQPVKPTEDYPKAEGPFDVCRACGVKTNG